MPTSGRILRTAQKSARQGIVNPHRNRPPTRVHACRPMRRVEPVEYPVSNTQTYNRIGKKDHEELPVLYYGVASESFSIDPTLGEG
jgi:hypothetical protein